MRTIGSYSCIDSIGQAKQSHPVHEGHARLLDVPMVDAVQLLHVGVSHLLDLTPVERALAHGEAVVLRGDVDQLEKEGGVHRVGMAVGGRG